MQIEIGVHKFNKKTKREEGELCSTSHQCWLQRI